MPNLALKLNFFTKNYKIFDNQTLVIWDITSQKDKKFYMQLRFIRENSSKINLNFIKEKLENHIENFKTINGLCFTDENKINFFNDLKNIDLDLNFTEIVHNKSRYKINNNRLVKEYTKNKIDLFCIDTFQNFRFGYEILLKNFTLLCCAQIYNERRLIKKIYFFPLNGCSLNNSISLLKKNIPHNQTNLNVPFVDYYPSLSQASTTYDKEIQTRINLQTIISEALSHFEKQKYFRKSSSKKAALFNQLAKNIASDKSLNAISDQLNQHDAWVVLAQHRDPWSFLSFFKGKTYSLIAWEALREELAQFNNLSSSQSLFHY